MTKVKCRIPESTGDSNIQQRDQGRAGRSGGQDDDVATGDDGAGRRAIMFDGSAVDRARREEIKSRVPCAPIVRLAVAARMWDQP